MKIESLATIPAGSGWKGPPPSEQSRAAFDLKVAWKANFSCATFGIGQPQSYQDRTKFTTFRRYASRVHFKLKCLGPKHSNPNKWNLLLFHPQPPWPPGWTQPLRPHSTGHSILASMSANKWHDLEWKKSESVRGGRTHWVGARESWAQAGKKEILRKTNPDRFIWDSLGLEREDW